MRAITPIEQLKVNAGSIDPESVIIEYSIVLGLIFGLHRGFQLPINERNPLLPFLTGALGGFTSYIAIMINK